MEFNSSQNICSSFLLKLPAVLNIETALTNKLDSLIDDQLKNTIESHCTVHIKLTEQYQSSLSDLAINVEALADQSNINSKIASLEISFSKIHNTDGIIKKVETQFDKYQKSLTTMLNDQTTNVAKASESANASSLIFHRICCTSHCIPSYRTKRKETVECYCPQIR